MKSKNRRLRAAIWPGGTPVQAVRLRFTCGPAQNRIRAALITGVFFITPPRIIYDLESRLRGIYLADLAEVVRAFFAQAGVEVLSVSPDDFVAAFEEALAS